MERTNASKHSDRIVDRIDTIQMGAAEREHAKIMMQRAERFADAIVEVTAAVRGITAQTRRALARRLHARRFQGAR